MPAYGDVGKVAKDLMLGSAKSGAFSYDPKLSFGSTTSSGVAFAVTAIKKADKIDGTVKIAYATKKYSADISLDPSGKALLNAGLSELAPGVKLSGSVALPDPSTAKLAVDYAPCKEFAMKTTVSLTSAPTIDVSAGAEWHGAVLGGEAAYDTAKSTITKYNIGVGYNTPEYQVAAHLTDLASVAKLSYAHVVNTSTTLGAEVSRKVASGDTTFTLGYLKKLPSGALAKLKLDNAGTLSALYETKLASGEKVAGSLQLQGTDLSKPIKYGFALDLS